MPRHAWLRYPAATIRPTFTCPTGLPRFRTVDLARQSLAYGTTVPFTASVCDQCNGAHITRRNP